MNYLFLLLSMFIVFSCSPKKQFDSQQININEAVFMEEVRYDANSGVWDVSSIDIVAEVNEIVEQNIQITNGGRSTLVLSSAVLNGFGSEMTMDSSSCDNISLRRRQSCFIKLTLNSSSLSEGDSILGSISINGSNQDISVSVNNPVEVVSPLTIQPSLNVDFGDFTKTDEKRNMIITIYNGTRQTQPVELGTFQNGLYTIAETTCGSTLSRRRKCIVNFEYTSPSTILSSELVTDSLSILGNNVNLQSNLIFDAGIDDCSVVEPQWSISRYDEENGQRIIDLENNDSVTLLVRNISRNTRDFCIDDKNLDTLKVNYSNCNNVGRYRYCYLKFEKISDLLSDHEIIMNGISYLIKTNAPTSIACEESDAQSNGYNINLYENIIGDKPLDNSDLTQCSISCPSGYTLDNGLKSCVKACEEPNAIANLVNINSVLSYKGQVVANDVSQCLIDSCANNYEKSIDEKSCNLIQCSLTNLGDIDNTNNQVLTVSGNYSSGCLVESCNTNYESSVDQKSCVVKSCNDIASLQLYDSNINSGLSEIINISGDFINGCNYNCNTGYSVSSVGCTKDENTITINMNYINDGSLSITGGSINSCNSSQCIVNVNSGSELSIQPNYPTNYTGVLYNNNVCSDNQNCTFTPTQDEVLSIDFTKSCTTSDAVSNGVDLSNYSTLTGEVINNNISQCLINSCVEDYEVSGNSKSCDVIIRSCDANDVGFSSLLNVTISGTVTGSDTSSCSVQCDIDYEESGVSPNKTCQPQPFCASKIYNPVAGIVPSYGFNVLMTNGEVYGWGTNSTLVNERSIYRVTSEELYNGLLYERINTTDTNPSTNKRWRNANSNAIINMPATNNIKKVLNAGDTNKWLVLDNNSNAYYYNTSNQTFNNVKDIAVSKSTRGHAILFNDGTVQVFGAADQGGSLSDSVYGLDCDGSGPLIKGAVGNIECLNDVTSIHSLVNGFVAIKADSTLRAWGNEVSFDGISQTETGFVSVYSMGGSGCEIVGLKSDKTVTRWDSCSNSYREPLGTLNNIETIVSAQSAFSALKTDGTTVSWGFFNSGVQDSFSNVNRIVSGKNVRGFAYIHNDKTVSFSGNSGGGFDINNATNGLDCDKSGTLSKGAAGNTSCLTNVKDVALHFFGIAVLKEDGEVHVWGDNSYLPGSFIVNTLSNTCN